MHATNPLPHASWEAAEFTPERNRTAGGAVLPNDPPQFGRFMTGSRPIDLEGIDWDAIPDHPLPDDVLRVLAYMQDVESHTVVFPRTIFSKRALEDEHVGPFLICWLYEEGMHGRALAKFLERAGRPVPPRVKARTTLRDRLDRAVTWMLSAGWKDFLALHMTWGAVHECTTIQAYRRLEAQNEHPILNELLRRIIRDEARHYAFYLWQAEQRLADPRVARLVRAIMTRFYTPVGASHQPDALARWVSGFLFDGDEGRAAANHVDQSINKLPGLAEATLLGRWLQRNVYR
ncbi:MAG TPA: ferritin-like domain-containing protein [Thermoanaerobaculia bacterium]